ncbi:hypothetical protein, partial [Thiolapillus sp.]|uniref:hypothetical protein n=1 Tax=Thiolapillus sp. TaxID=2017437 RepID=UPI0025D86F7B
MNNSLTGLATADRAIHLESRPISGSRQVPSRNPRASLLGVTATEMLFGTTYSYIGQSMLYI